jgi:hypothetical protein
MCATDIIYLLRKLSLSSKPTPWISCHWHTIVPWKSSYCSKFPSSKFVPLTYKFLLEIHAHKTSFLPWKMGYQTVIKYLEMHATRPPFQPRNMCWKPLPIPSHNLWFSSSTKGFCFSKVSCLAMVIWMMDCLHIFTYTLDVLWHLLLNKHVMNTFIIYDIYN